MPYEGGIGGDYTGELKITPDERLGLDFTFKPEQFGLQGNAGEFKLKDLLDQGSVQVGATKLELTKEDYPPQIVITAADGTSKQER